MPSFLESLPFWIAFTLLFIGGMLRGQMMYWIGRATSKVTLDHMAPSARIAKIRSWVDRGGADSGINAIHRWGAVMVPVSYLTVGFQSVVQVAAGLLQMNVLLYALAQIPGALAWAAIYSTIGFAAWGAIVSAAAGSPSGVIVVVLIAIILVYFIIRRRRLRTGSVLTDEPVASVPKMHDVIAEIAGIDDSSARDSSAEGVTIENSHTQEAPPE